MSKFHEERLIALFILVNRFKKCTDIENEEIVHFYLDHTAYINNWDLVDSSADKILGEYLLRSRDSATQFASPVVRDRNDILEKLAISESVWERRIAILATFQFIKSGEYDLTFSIAEILLYDKHDLIQKAVGWMLRYAIEKFPEEIRQAYLRGQV